MSWPVVFLAAGLAGLAAGIVYGKWHDSWMPWRLHVLMGAAWSLLAISIAIFIAVIMRIDW